MLIIIYVDRVISTVLSLTLCGYPLVLRPYEIDPSEAVYFCISVIRATDPRIIAGFN